RGKKTLSGFVIATSRPAASSRICGDLLTKPVLPSLFVALLAQHTGHALEQLPADDAVGLHDRPEVPVGESVAAQIAHGGDRRHARAVVDQGDLAEELAGL